MMYGNMLNPAGKTWTAQFTRTAPLWGCALALFAFRLRLRIVPFFFIENVFIEIDIDIDIFLEKPLGGCPAC